MTREGLTMALLLCVFTTSEKPSSMGAGKMYQALRRSQPLVQEEIQRGKFTGW